jgi:hypothetical protein
VTLALDTHRSGAQPGVSPIAASNARLRSRLRIAGVASGLILWEGVFPAVLGMPRWYGAYIAVAVIIAHAFYWLLRFLMGRGTPRITLLIALVFVWFFMVSALSSTLIFKYDPREWLFAQYLIVPILVPITLYLWGTTAREVVMGILVAATIAAVLTLGAPFGLRPLITVFERPSLYDRNYVRVVILKNEIAFSAVYLFFQVLSSRRPLQTLLPQILMTSVFFYLLVFALDSRLAMAATAIAICIGFIVLPGSIYRKIPIMLVVVIVVVLIFPGVYDRYIGSIGLESYIQEGNVQVRFDELAFLWRYFEETGGLGFGVFSNSPESRNFSAYMMYNLYGDGTTGLGVADIAIFGSIVQFGWIGFAVTLGATFWCMRQFFVPGRQKTNPDRALGVAGFSFMFGFMLSPWPMDFFTLNWTILFGWTLLYLAWRYRVEGAAMMPATQGQSTLRHP